MDQRVALALLAGVAVVKTTMVLLDKSGTLAKLPPWLRPMIPVVASAVVGLLQALAAGVDPVTAALGAASALGLSESSHSLSRGVKKHRAEKGSISLAE